VLGDCDGVGVAVSGIEASTLTSLLAGRGLDAWLSGFRASTAATAAATTISVAAAIALETVHPSDWGLCPRVGAGVREARGKDSCYVTHGRDQRGRNLVQDRSNVVRAASASCGCWASISVLVIAGGTDCRAVVRSGMVNAGGGSSSTVETLAATLSRVDLVSAAMAGVAWAMAKSAAAVAPTPSHRSGGIRERRRDRPVWRCGAWSLS
jgi:ribosomal protein L12E/L44/L45/RPP1/RPP2